MDQLTQQASADAARVEGQLSSYLQPDQPSDQQSDQPSDQVCKQRISTQPHMYNIDHAKLIVGIKLKGRLQLQATT